MKLALLLTFFFLSAFVEEAKAVYVGKAKQDCRCTVNAFGEESHTIYHAKKDTLVGGLCFEDGKDNISCTKGFPENIHCPKACIQLMVQNKLKKEDYIAAVKKAEVKARTAYGQVVPKNILNELQKKYPSWIPVLINHSDDTNYLTKYELEQKFYFHLPLQVNNKLTDVSIIYFYQDMDHLIRNSSSWSFWDSKTAELIFEKVADYKSVESGYVNMPCLAPAGQNLKSTVLYGMMAGPGDAAPCCGPYDLSDLKKSGPQLIKRTESEHILDEIAYDFCRNSYAYGDKTPPTLNLIDGPANIREADSLNAKIIGSCSDKALAADLGTSGKWVKVYCEGKTGYTSRNNIRPKNN